MTVKKNMGNKSKGALLVLSILSIIVSVYLLFHYYDVHYPKSIGGDSFCSISGYFNCDTATLSSLSNVFGVPIAAFGIILSLLFLLASIIDSPKMHRANYLFATLNILGCLSLFFYSILALKSLCPGCTVYYILSLGIFFVYFLYFKFKFYVDVKMVSLYTLLFAVGFVGFYFKTIYEQKNVTIKLSELIEDFNKQKVLDEAPLSLSEVIFTPKNKTFQNSPIRVQIFTDYECGICAYFNSTVLTPLKKIYKDSMSIQYFLFPLDDACNENLTKPFHPSACLAAKYALCHKEDFDSVSDSLYRSGVKLKDYLDENIDEKIEKCINSAKTTQELQNMIDAGEKIGLRGTPTILINGKKIGAGLPLKFYDRLFAFILSQTP